MADTTWHSDRPCIKCGSQERYKQTNACAACARKAAYKYRKNNLGYSRISSLDRQQIARERRIKENG